MKLSKALQTKAGDDFKEILYRRHVSEKNSFHLMCAGEMATFHEITFSKNKEFSTQPSNYFVMKSEDFLRYRPSISN